MFDFHSATFLRRVLWLDAITCVATGSLMTLAAQPLAALLHMPAPLLFYAGLGLIPVAAVIAMVASRAVIPAAGVRLVILGNAAWVFASLALLTDQRVTPNLLGTAFVLAQAAVVAILAELEYTALKRSTELAGH